MASSQSFLASPNIGPVRPDNALNYVTAGNPIQARVQAAAAAAIPAGAQTASTPDAKLTNQEIEAFSLLRKPDSGQIKQQFQGLLRTTDAAKVTVNFLGSGIATGDKQLDGMNDWETNFGLWSWLFEDLLSLTGAQTNEGQLLANLKVGVDKLKANASFLSQLMQPGITDERRYKLAVEFAEKLRDLKPGETEPFNGGYFNEGAADSSSHAQIYDFIRRSDGKIDILGYTSTGFQLAEVIGMGAKMRLNPLVPFEAIPEQTLLLNSDRKLRPAFVASLMEIRGRLNQSRDSNVSDEDILQVFDLIIPYRPADPRRECGFITGQRGGTCLPSVTKAWIRHHCKNIHFYKQVMFHCKMKMLSACFLSLEATLKDDTDAGAKGREALRQAACNFQRACRKMLERSQEMCQMHYPLIQASKAMQALATAQDILDRLENFEAAIRQEREKLTVDSDLSLVNADIQRERRSEIWYNGVDVSPAQQPLPIALPNFSIQLDPCRAGRSLIDAIRQTKNTCDSIDRTISSSLSTATVSQMIRAYNLQIHHLIDQIPLPQVGPMRFEREFVVEKFSAEFWKDFTLEELQEVQRELYELILPCYVDRQYYLKDSTARFITTTLSMHVLMHFLAMKIEAKRLKTYPNHRDRLIENYSMPSFLNVLEVNGLQFFDKAEFDRACQASSYINSFNKLVEGEILFANEMRTEVNNSKIEKCPANGKILVGVITVRSKIKRLR